MGLSESLYDWVLQSKNPALNPDHLHKCARLWGRCFWGNQYPDQEVLDDIENYRALELLHTGFSFRYRIWATLVGSGAETDTAESLSREINSTRDVGLLSNSAQTLVSVVFITNVTRNFPIFL